MKFQVKWCLFDKSVISIFFGAPVEQEEEGFFDGVGWLFGKGY